MKAAYYSGNKSFTVREDSPGDPEAGDVRLRIAYCGICGTDLHVYHGAMDARVTTNRVIGHECSTVVDAIGPGVDGFEPGDPVVVRPLSHCGECPACKRSHTHICQNLKFFWRELELLGARVYQPEDYEQAIERVLSGAIHCDTLITDSRELEDITEAFQALDGNATAMKSLLKCSS